MLQELAHWHKKGNGVKARAAAAQANVRLHEQAI